MSHSYHSLVPRCLCSLLLGTGVAWAFPPAPYYTLYGVVRDQVGQTVTAEGAEVILLKGGVEVGIVSAFTMPRSDTHEFYRHSVR